jgi:Tol biopolymer transport system component
VDDAGAFGVYVVRSGEEPRRITDALGTDGIEWSPDGGSLVLDRIESDRSVIEVVAMDGSDERVLVEGPNHEGPGAPVWSPDGRRIAFIRTPRVGTGYSTEIWVVGADERGGLRLGMTSGSLGDGPVWSPDSQLVAWSSVVPGYWVAVDADRGGFPEQVDQLVVEQWRQG